MVGVATAIVVFVVVVATVIVVPAVVVVRYYRCNDAIVCMHGVAVAVMVMVQPG